MTDDESNVPDEGDGEESGGGDEGAIGSDSDEPAADPGSEADQIIQYLEFIRQQLDGLGQQNEYLALALEENLRAQQTIKKLKETEPGSETLVPVGAGVLVKARSEGSPTVMVNLGRGVVADVKDEQALDILARRYENLASNQDRLFKSIEGLRQQAGALQARLDELSQEEGGQDGDGGPWGSNRPRAG